MTPHDHIAAHGRRRSTSAARDVARGQLVFLAGVAICVALHPGVVLKSDEGGLSNYGVHLRTVVPYTVAFLAPSLASARGAHVVDRDDVSARRLRRVLRGYAVLLVATLLSTYPYQINATWKDIHVAVGVVLFVFELLATASVVRTLRGGRVVAAASAVVIGFVLAALTFVGAIHLLFVAQVVTGGAFAVVLVDATRAWT